MKTIIKKFAPWLILSAVIYCVCALIETYFALVLGEIIDSAVGNQLHTMLLQVGRAVLLLVGLLVFYRVAIEARRQYVMRCVTAIKKSLMEAVYRRGLVNYNTNTESYYLNLLSNDMEMIESDYLLPMPLIAFYIAQFLSSVGALFYLNWKIALFFMALTILPIVVPPLFGSLLAKRKKIVSEQNESFMSVLKEQVQGMADIQYNLAIHTFLKRFAEVNVKQQTAKKRAGVLETYLNECSSICAAISQLGCIAIGGYFVIQGEFLVGEMIAAIQLLNSVFSPISSFSQNYVQISGTSKIRKKIGEELANNQSDGDGAVPASPVSLDYDNVTIWYEGQDALVDHFTHHFGGNGFYAVIGGSGSGKTTLFKCLLKNHLDYSGEILLNEKNIASLSPQTIYQHVGFMPQAITLFHDTVEYNITLGNAYSEQELQELITKMGLTHLKGRVLHDGDTNISGGERQRIALARMLIRHPQIIVFDEPTASLDPQNRDAVNALIAGLTQYTRIVITHDQRPEYLDQFDEVIDLAALA